MGVPREKLYMARVTAERRGKIVRRKAHIRDSYLARQDKASKAIDEAIEAIEAARLALDEARAKAELWV